VSVGEEVNMAKEVLMKAILTIFFGIDLKLVPGKYLRSANQKNHATQQCRLCNF
jgi:hypothetical protein